MVIVTGAPPAFCTGADLDDLLAARDPGNIHEIYRGFLRIAHSPLPTLAAVNGPAVGAGLNMALACDVIIAGESARFDSRFLDIGIHPGGGHTWRLRNKTDDQTLRAMVLFGDILSGARAAEVGLAWRCVPDVELMATAREMAARAASFPARLARATKVAMADLPGIDTSPASVEHELRPQLHSMTSPEFTELVAKLARTISSKDG